MMSNISSQHQSRLIKKTYKKRRLAGIYEFDYYSYFLKCERYLHFWKIIGALDGGSDDIQDKKLLEIGAGIGENLLFFLRTGIRPVNIYANELLDDRLNILKENFPSSVIYEGNAFDIDCDIGFDVVFQSLVFTSILDNDFKKQLANKMYDMTKDGGIVLWYDFKYNNPKNKNVKGIGKKEIINLFPKASSIDFHNVTLAPPIGRRVGRFYNLFNFLLPFLRSHIIAVIHK